MAKSKKAVVDYGTGEKTLGIYSLGIVLCIILTIIPFAAVEQGTYNTSTTIAIILVSAAIQFLVQCICFLRLNYQTPQAKMNVQSFVFTIVLLTILIVGTLWIMWSLNYHMMGHHT